MNTIDMIYDIAVRTEGKVDRLAEESASQHERLDALESARKERNSGLVALLSSVVGAVAGSVGSWIAQGRGA